MVRSRIGTCSASELTLKPGGAVLHLAGARRRAGRRRRGRRRSPRHAGRQTPHAGRRQLLHATRERAVVGRRARPDVGRRHRQPAGQQRPAAGAAGPVDARQAVELPDVQVRIGDRGDRAGVVQERGRVGDFGRELPLERDVLDRVAVVVDVDLVDDVRVERVEVRPAIGLLERDDVGDERHHRRARWGPRRRTGRCCRPTDPARSAAPRGGSTPARASSPTRALPRHRARSLACAFTAHLLTSRDSGSYRGLRWAHGIGCLNER